MTPERPPLRGRSAERRREALREIREELERIRRAEARVAEALGSLRAARQRVEELASSFGAEDESVRDIVRQELMAVGAAPGAGASAGGGEDAGGAAATGDPGATARQAEEAARREGPPVLDPSEDTRQSFWLVGVAATSVLVVAAVAWLAVQAFTGETQPQTITLVGDSAPEVSPVSGAEPMESLGEEPRAPEDDAERFFTLLPEGVEARAAVYDSLWLARSPIFAPLVERIESETEEGTVERAIVAWRDGSATPLQTDLLHSAFVQYALRQEMGADLAVDGQLLRNPCRGASCSALLNFWETRGGEHALPPVPEDAPRNTQALRVAESVLVLSELQDLHLGATAQEG